MISPEIHQSFADTFFANMALIRANKMKKDSNVFQHNCHALHFVRGFVTTIAHPVELKILKWM